jgi:hypothetical protein
MLQSRGIDVAISVHPTEFGDSARFGGTAVGLSPDVVAAPDIVFSSIKVLVHR